MTAKELINALSLYDPDSRVFLSYRASDGMIDLESVDELTERCEDEALDPRMVILSREE